MISEIGFGAWGIGGKSKDAPGYGEVDDKESIKALRLAFEKGVNFFDTADLYGSGHSESIIAEAFSGLRDKIIIASKGGTLPHTGLYMPQDFSARHLNNSLDKSLKRLKADYIDIYQLHSPKINDIEENNVIETLECFKSQGKIREYGISVRSPEDGIACIQKHKTPCLQVNFNLIDQRAKESGLFDLAKSTGTGIIVRTPLVFGFLTGKITTDYSFKPHDHRLNYPKEQLARWEDSSTIFSFLYKNKTPVQAALRFCLDFEAVLTVIPGMNNVEEVKENLISSNLTPFSDEEHMKITEVYNKHKFFKT